MGIFTVSELNQHVKHTLKSEPTLKEIWVRGEVSNLTIHRSGHYYFTIKDKESQINCVCFNYINKNIKFKPEKDMNLLVFGYVDIYTVRGQYQLHVLDMRADGIGELYQAFEQLKEKLGRKGFFDEKNKKPIPKIPSKVGIITSPTGAALHDILNVAKRRVPVHIIFCPAIVQGDKSALSIVNAINQLNELSPDVIIIGRGGGSIEDLWSFNEEIVAKSIYESNVPIVSAVGHETDYTIADFTADLRASTPSSAVEIVIPSKTEISNQVHSLIQRLKRSQQYKINELKNILYQNSSKFEPLKFKDQLNQNYLLIDDSLNKMENKVEMILNNKNATYREYVGRLDAVSPLNTIKRGYSIPLDEHKDIIYSVKNLGIGDRVSIILSDGTIQCKVEDIKNSSSFLNK